MDSTQAGPAAWTVAGALVGYAMLGLFGRSASFVWAFGVTMLALNFAVWAFALHVLV